MNRPQGEISRRKQYRKSHDPGWFKMAVCFPTCFVLQESLLLVFYYRKFYKLLWMLLWTDAPVRVPLSKCTFPSFIGFALVIMSFLWSFQSSCQKDKAIFALLLPFIIAAAAWWCAKNSLGISWSWAYGYTCVFMLILWKHWTWKFNSHALWSVCESICGIPANVTEM